MSEMPKEIWSCPLDLRPRCVVGTKAELAKTRYVRGDIADELLKALEAVAADARERDRQAGDPVLAQVLAAIKKVEE